jgi:hypothetical protein
MFFLKKLHCTQVCLIFTGILSSMVLINCDSGTGGGGGGGGGNSKCIRDGFEKFTNTIKDIMDECNATKVQVLAQIQGDDVGDCKKDELPTDKAISWIAYYCKVSEITLVPSGGGSSNSGGKGSSSSGDNGGGSNGSLTCSMTATSVTIGSNISPAPTVKCNTTSVSSSITWQNNPPIETGILTVKAIATCNGSSQTATCGTITVNPVYCDYGYATTDEPVDKCDEVTEIDIGDEVCDLAWGKVVKSCNSSDRRTDIVYCDWGKATPAGGGCYRAESTFACTRDSGNPVTKCPTSSLFY